MLVNATAKLQSLRFAERDAVRLGGDAVPQFLHVEDALGGRHVVEGGIHAGIVVAGHGGGQHRLRRSRSRAGAEDQIRRAAAQAASIPPSLLL